MAAPVWLAATAVTAVAGGLAWAYYALQGSTPADGEHPTPVGKVRRTGPKPLLALAASTLPPTWLISRISDVYDLYLLFPSVAPFPFPAQYGPTSLEASKVLFHETPEGLTHIARTLGGTLVFVNPSVEGDPLPPEAGQVGLVDVEKLRKDTASFVREFVEVGGGTEEKCLRGWEDLAARLKV